MNTARKPFIIYFRNDNYKKTCSLTEPVEFLQRIIGEFHSDIDFYKVHKHPTGAFDTDLFSILRVDELELPFFIAFNFIGDEWKEVGRVLPNPIKSQEQFGEQVMERFNYNEIYNLCVKLIQGIFYYSIRN